MVVIGGGIVGCATLYFLARAGLRALMVERDGVAGGTSGACMGHLMMMPGPELMFRFSTHSLELWRRFHADLGGFDLRACGCLWLGESTEDEAVLEDLLRTVQGLGGTSELLDAKSLHKKEPGLARDLIGAFYYPGDGVVFPMQACSALLREALRLGAEVRTGCSAVGLQRDGSGAVRALLTDQGDISTAAVVNCAGVWAPDQTEAAGLGRVPIFPRRGDLAITMPRDLPVSHQMVEVAYLRTATGKVADPEDENPDPGAFALNLQPQTNGTLLVGSSRQFCGMDRAVRPGLLQQSLARAQRFVPRLGDLQLVRSWAGLRPYTRDKMPMVGAVPGLPGYYLNAGHEGLGITLCMASAELIATQLRGQEFCMDASALGADRAFSEMQHG